MKIVFFGSSDFSLPALDAVAEKTVLVVTRKGKPRGRGYVLDDNAVKQRAAELSIPVREVASFRDDPFDDVRALGADVYLVVSFGLIIPRPVLDMPSIGPLNVHPSLLPAYRGPSPIQWSLLRGDRETGITIMRMNEKMDGGPILHQERFGIADSDDYPVLSEKLARRAGEILSPFMETVEREGLPPAVPQDEGTATYTAIVTKEMGEITWEQPADEIRNRIRAFSGWPVAYTFIDGKMLKIFRATVERSETAGLPGEVLSVSKDGFLVHTGSMSLSVNDVQLENKKRMSASQFANGYRKMVGTILGKGRR